MTICISNSCHDVDSTIVDDDAFQRQIFSKKSKGEVADS